MVSERNTTILDSFLRLKNKCKRISGPYLLFLVTKCVHARIETGANSALHQVPKIRPFIRRVKILLVEII